MGRQVRRVPPGWQHPRDAAGDFIPLYDGNEFEPAVKEWDEGAERWRRGVYPAYAMPEHIARPYEEWDGPRPDAADYMPRWTKGEATHYMMYETTTEGTPISPAFPTPEELARWLADSLASACGPLTASYDDWLRVARGGYACTLVLDPADGSMTSGVAGVRIEERE